MEGSYCIFTNDAFFQNMLYCNLCKNMFSNDIYINKNEENVCEKCALTSIDTKNTQLMKIIKNIKVACKFHINDEGSCNEIMFYRDLKAHHKVCRYRSIKCPLDENCQWEGNLLELNKHADWKHLELIIIKNPVTFRQGMDQDFKIIRQVKVESKRYLLRLEYNKNRKILTYLVYTDLINDQEDTFSIQLISGVTGNNFELSQKVFTGHFENFFEKMYNFSIDLTKLNHFVDVSEYLDILVRMPGPYPIKEILRSDLLSALECPVCRNVMAGNIYQCRVGHSVCHNCMPGCQLCPTCRGEMGFGTRDIRNYTVEKLSSLITPDLKGMKLAIPRKLN